MRIQEPFLSCIIVSPKNGCTALTFFFAYVGTNGFGIVGLGWPVRLKNP